MEKYVDTIYGSRLILRGPWYPVNTFVANCIRSYIKVRTLPRYSTDSGLHSMQDMANVVLPYLSSHRRLEAESLLAHNKLVGHFVYNGLTSWKLVMVIPRFSIPTMTTKIDKPTVR